MLRYKDSQANKGGIYITKLLFQFNYTAWFPSLNFKDIWLLRDLNFRSSVCASLYYKSQKFFLYGSLHYYYTTYWGADCITKWRWVAHHFPSSIVLHKTISHNQTIDDKVPKKCGFPVIIIIFLLDSQIAPSQSNYSQLVVVLLYHCADSANEDLPQSQLGAHSQVPTSWNKIF